MKITIVGQDTNPAEKEVELKLTTRKSFGVDFVEVKGREKGKHDWMRLLSFSPVAKDSTTRVSTCSGNMTKLGFPKFYGA